jgi:hypothetical protein
VSFPSETGGRASLAFVWERALSLSARVKMSAQQIRAVSLNNTLTGQQVIEFSAYLADAKTKFQAVAATPGIAAFAQEQISDPAFNVATEFQAMVAGIDSTVAWIAANMPAASGYLQVITLNANGTYTWRVFTAAATAGFRTQLDALIATID